MSILFVNGKQRPTSFDDGLLVSEIIEQHIEPKLPDGQVVYMVGVDDRVEEIDALQWGQFDRLEVQIAHPYQLVIDGLESSIEVVRGMDEHVRQAVNCLRLGQVDAFGPLFVNVIDSLLSFLRFLHLAMAHLEQHGSGLAGFEGELKDAIDQIFAAQKDEDMVLVADLLEYELSPLFEQWESVCQLEREKLQVFFEENPVEDVARALA
jgi:hypothetical protein